MKIEGPSAAGLQAMLLDDEPRLLEQGFRLRYQVYCVERRYLHAENYPDQLERDDFDRASTHVGAVDRYGELAATARLVKPNSAGLPLFHYCSLFPFERTLEDNANLVVEVSRVSISRGYARDRAAAATNDRRLRYAEPFLTLLKAVISAARHVGATHLIGATDAALHRRLVRFGFPYRVAGPQVDYYGLVAPHIMSLAELDEVILGGQFLALSDFPVGTTATAELARLRGSQGEAPSYAACSGRSATRRGEGGLALDEHAGRLAWNREERAELTG